MADFFSTGERPRNQESKYVGKHIGGCSKCGFSLLANTDEKCPRCEAKIKPLKSKTN